MLKDDKNSSNYLFITHSAESTGGAEDDFERLIKYFHSLNKKIDVLCPTGPRVPDYKKYSSNLFNYSWGFFPVIPENIFHYIKYSVKALLQFWQIHKIIKNKNYDICLLNVSVLIAPLIYLKLRKIKTVVYIRETVEPAWIRKYLYKLLNKCAVYYLPVSDSIRNEFIEVTHNNNSTTIYSAIEESDDYYSNTPEILLNKINQNAYDLLLSKTKYKLLTIGGISERKNQKLIAETILELKKNNYANIPVLICAGKIDPELNYYKRFKSYLDENDLNDDVYLLGETTKSQTFQLFKCCDALVIPSLSEGMPLTLVEAFKFERIIFSTDVGGISEVLINRHNGILFKDYKELLTVITEIMELPEFSNQIVKNAKVTYNEKFNLNNNLNQIKNIFDKLIRSRIS